MPSNNVLVVTMTGFTTDPLEQQYKTMISDLELRLAAKLSEQTHVLIVKTVNTQKYKIAKAYKDPIMCVKIDWLVDSHSQGIIVPPDEYQITELLYGLDIKIIQFGEQRHELWEKAQQIMIQHGAKVEILKQAQYRQTAKKIDTHLALLESQNDAIRLRGYYPHILHPIVTLEWLRDSLNKKLCKMPEDYALNAYYLRRRQPVQHAKKMKVKLEFCLQKANSELSSSGLMFDNLIFYLNNNIHPELRHTLKQLIEVNGGFCLQVPTLLTTHILTDYLKEDQYIEFKKNSTLLFILKVEWLIDCIYLDRRIEQENYFIRSFKGNQMKRPFLRINIALGQDSSSLYSCQKTTTITQQVEQQQSETYQKIKRRSISVTTQIQYKSTKSIKRTIFRSQIFNGLYFYVESSHRNEFELNNIGQQIARHKGHVFQARAQIDSDSCFHVLKDCKGWSELTYKLKRQTKGKVDLFSISYRWVKECIQKNLFIHPYKVQSYVYKPMPFETPVREFQMMVFDIIGLPMDKKRSLQELLNIMGSVKNRPNKSEVTHCLCGQGYLSVPRTYELCKENPKVVFLKWEWLLESSKIGKALDYDKYRCEVPLEHAKHSCMLPLQDMRMEVNESREMVSVNTSDYDESIK